MVGSLAGLPPWPNLAWCFQCFDISYFDYGAVKLRVVIEELREVLGCKYKVLHLSLESTCDTVTQFRNEFEETTAGPQRSLHWQVETLQIAAVFRNGHRRI